MYGNIKSLCSMTGTNCILGQLHFKNIQMHRNVIKFVVTWDGGGICEGELDKGSQKIQTLIKRKHIFFQLRSQHSMWDLTVNTVQYSQYSPVFLDFRGGSDGSEFACNAGDPSSIPGFWRSPRGRPLQHSCLENPYGRGGWQLHGVAKSQTWLSD